MNEHVGDPAFIRGTQVKGVGKRFDSLPRGPGGDMGVNELQPLRKKPQSPARGREGAWRRGHWAAPKGDTCSLDR